MKTAGIVIVTIGLLMSLYTGFQYVTREKVVDLGSIEVTKDSDHDDSWPFYLGIGIMVVGGLILTVGRKRHLPD
jgi:hypothetical protein